LGLRQAKFFASRKAEWSGLVCGTDKVEPPHPSGFACHLPLKGKALSLSLTSLGSFLIRGSLSEMARRFSKPCLAEENRVQAELFLSVDFDAPSGIKIGRDKLPTGERLRALPA